MSYYIVGCPPGVGDLLWCLMKLRDFKKQRGIERLMVAIQKTSKDRAAELCGMVDFVDAVRYVQFRSARAERDGFTDGPGAFNCVMWPNAVLDAGGRIDTWLPEYATEWDLPLKVESTLTDPARPVLYASAAGVNKSWFPDQGIQFWVQVAKELTDQFAAKPLLIGASWDSDFCEPLREWASPLIGLTTLPQVAYMLQTAPVVVGVASGMTILANHFGTPCVALFPDKHHEAFPFTWVREAYLPRYHVLRAHELRAIGAFRIGAMAHNLWRRRAGGEL